MEELIPMLRDKLKRAITVNVDEDKNKITLIINRETKISEELASPEEIKIMLHMFGKLEKDFPMNIVINNQEDIVEISLNSREDTVRVGNIAENIWNTSVEMLEQCLAGDFSGIKHIGNIDEM